MTSRLAVIGAGAAEGPEQAGALAAAIRRAPRGRRPAAVEEALGALAGAGLGVFGVGRPDARGALLEVPGREPGRLLEALLVLARFHGLAVYDIKARRLYDPRGAATGVEVVLDGLSLPFLTRSLLADLVARPPAGLPYLIVERAEQDYIQFWRHDDGVFQLEHRAGGPDAHFEHLTADADRVVAVMWAWASGDPSWRTRVDWTGVSLAEGAT